MKHIVWLAIAIGGAALAQNAATSNAGAWRFAISGDSRNCGDIVMPAIAQGVQPERRGILLAPGRFSRDLHLR